MEPDDSLNAGVVSFLEETGTLVLVSQRAEERFVLQLADNAHLQHSRSKYKSVSKVRGDSSFCNENNLLTKYIDYTREYFIDHLTI